MEGNWKKWFLHKLYRIDHWRSEVVERLDMTITPALRIADRKLIVKDQTILTGVPDSVLATSASSSGPVEGVFIGAEFDRENIAAVWSHSAPSVMSIF
ncbi:hypothetical protein Ancab_035159 [Ancistrocladus abbreviatus]